MLLSFLQVAFATLLFLVLPGFLLLRAFFPRPDQRGPPEERLLFALALSLAATIAVTGLLGFLPAPGKRGFYQTAATGFPFVELAMLFVCLVAFHVGYRRGAYPSLAGRMPWERGAGAGAGAPAGAGAGAGDGKEPPARRNPHLRE